MCEVTERQASVVFTEICFLRASGAVFSYYKDQRMIFIFTESLSFETTDKSLFYEMVIPRSITCAIYLFSRFQKHSA